MNVAESDPSIGICAVKLLRIDDPKVIDSTGHVIRWGSVIDRGHGRRDKQQYDDKNNVLGAKAAACLYKKRMLDDIGLFDEDFGTSWEDAELSWRAHRKGWKAKYVPTSLVYHRDGASIKRSPENLSKQILLSTKNEITLVGRYGSNWQKLLFTFGRIKSAFGNINGSLLKHYPLNVKSYIKIVLRGYFMLISAIFSSFLRLQEE